MIDRTLLISPHPDDISMSAFGIVTNRLIPGEMFLLTVFSWSDYIALNRGALYDLRTILNYPPRPLEFIDSVKRYAGRFGTNPISILEKLFGLRQPDRVSRIRQLEDLAFSRKTRMRYGHLDFRDCKLRHGRPIIDTSWPLEKDLETLNRLVLALNGTVSRLNVQVMVAPWPFGARQHLDHRLVNAAAASVAEGTGVKLLYLDDQPYSRRPLVAMKDSRGQMYAPRLLGLSPSEMKRKSDAMKIYRSQMVPEYFQAVRRTPPGSAGNSYSETLWEPSRGASQSADARMVGY